MKLIDLTGKVFGRLTVKRRRKKNNKWNQSVWICICSCSPELERSIDGAMLSSGKTTSCGCYRREFRRLEYGEASRNRLLNRYKKEATDRGLKFTLSDQEAIALFESVCFYCGAGPMQKMYAANMYGEYLYNGIDRRNNKEDYTVVNCVSCCGICNHMKNDLGEKEFFDHVRRIYEHTKWS